MPVTEAPDWFVEPFASDGAVNWPVARQWVGDMHITLRERLGPEAWTDELAGWLGRLSHDALSFQGVMLAQATPADLEDLLFTLLPSRNEALPGSPAAAIGALRAMYLYGVEQVGSLHAAAAVAWLEADGREEQLSRALGGRVSTPKRTGRRMPRRKKKRRNKD
jgi:hypothetical protein